ncbi:NAD kinase [Castellaniella defragrans]|jgi:NAD+ kinase|uniref:NAD kinase n=2 Tax=Castellaniella defragrans TaxID=75697 RepID=W8X3H9_CASD6|nr:NAD kinase [Castellaniella defragrans]KAB0615347.1 NAD kinase [Castellaniella defragrans]MBB6082940.1 NAD+ kinase [Castellaniella defragrans]CDM23791.1 NAD kinase [Castellaniella defragrans 65Phen]
MHFKTVALIGRHQDSGMDAPLRRLGRVLSSAGCDVLIEADTGRNTGVADFPLASYEDIGARADLAIIMGGDGTMLAAARQLATSGVAMIGINHGRLGFITDIPLGSADEAITRVLNGAFVQDERILLEGRVMRGGETIFSGLALNDVIINRAGRGGMIELRVECNGAFMHSQRADGLIIATPTGSTAYALSAGGPILHPQVNALVLVPVAPQTLSNRPITLPDDSVLNITISALGRVESGASVHFDMQALSNCQEGDRIDVRRSPHRVRFLHPQGYSYFSTLRSKLNWNRMLHPWDEPDQ